MKVPNKIKDMSAWMLYKHKIADSYTPFMKWASKQGLVSIDLSSEKRIQEEVEFLVKRYRMMLHENNDFGSARNA